MLRVGKMKAADIYEDPNFDPWLDLTVAGAQLFVNRLLAAITG
jgi:hypothetical protein